MKLPASTFTVNLISNSSTETFPNNTLYPRNIFESATNSHTSEQIERFVASCPIGNIMAIKCQKCHKWYC